MSRENVLGIGCAITFAVSMAIFISAGTRDFRDPGRNPLFAWAFAVAALGLMLVLLAWGVMLWLDVRRTRETEQALIERAERLRRERMENRQRQAAEPEARLAEMSVATSQATGRSRKVLSLDDSPADVVLIPPTSTAIARATRTLGVCPLCQTNIVEGEEYLSCPACRARYHPDCWQYNRGCAVYGCKVRIRA